MGSIEALTARFLMERVCRLISAPEGYLLVSHRPSAHTRLSARNTPQQSPEKRDPHSDWFFRSGNPCPFRFDRRGVYGARR